MLERTRSQGDSCRANSPYGSRGSWRGLGCHSGASGFPAPERSASRGDRTQGHEQQRRGEWCYRSDPKPPACRGTPSLMVQEPRRSGSRLGPAYRHRSSRTEHQAPTFSCVGFLQALATELSANPGSAHVLRDWVLSLSW